MERDELEGVAGAARRRNSLSRGKESAMFCHTQAPRYGEEVRCPGRY